MKTALVVLLALIPAVALADQADDIRSGVLKQCRGCDLSNADFKKADLTGVDLSGANLEGASFTAPF